MAYEAEIFTGTGFMPFPYVRRFAVMENKHKNENIRCTVSQCQHNMVTEDYCSLGCISVGTHEDNPTVPECTDCNSFVKRTGCCE